jgi:RNA polymerase sigma-70 factor, ECF subfamily
VGYLPQPPRAEVRTVRGEPVVVFWYMHRDGEALRNLARIETSSRRISLVRHYFFAPDVIAEVCQELDAPFRTNGYRDWPTTRPRP